MRNYFRWGIVQARLVIILKNQLNSGTGCNNYHKNEEKFEMSQEEGQQNSKKHI